MRSIIFIIVFALSTSLMGQSSHSLKRDGDASYMQADYGQAEIDYHKAYDKERDHKSTFNLGNALFQQERYEEAATYFENSVELMPDATAKSMAYHNLGNAFLKQQKIEESIEAYKKAIRLNPNDSDIKENLLLAKMAKLQQEQQQQQQQQEQQQDQNQENQENQEQQQEQNQEKQEQQQEQQDSTQQQQAQQDSLQQQQAQESELDSTQIDSSQLIPAIKLSKEEAARLLQAAEQEERKVQEKLKRVKSNKKKPTKDW